MSAYYVKIIPDDPYCRVDTATAKKVCSYLDECMIAMSVEIGIGFSESAEAIGTASYRGSRAAAGSAH